MKKANTYLSQCCGSVSVSPRAISNLS